jgi:hypothetical protein
LRVTFLAFTAVMVQQSASKKMVNFAQKLG